MEADILSAINGQCEEFWIFFLHSPILTSHTFPLKIMNPKNLICEASHGLQKEGAQISQSFAYLILNSLVLLYDNGNHIQIDADHSTLNPIPTGPEGAFQVPGGGLLGPPPIEGPGRPKT